LTGREVLAIVTGGDFQDAHESRSHLFLAAIAARAGDSFNAVVGLLKTPASVVQAYRFNRLRRSPASLLGVHARAVARTHVNAACKVLYLQISRQVLPDPAFKRGEPLRIRLGLSGEQGAVLRLSASAFEINDKHACNADGHFSTEIFFD